MTAQVKTGLIVKQDFFVVELFAGAQFWQFGWE
jgi:DNA (cytosine-5)-methyltransferase 1